jgi:predicted small lipoprotein YifL
MMMFMNRCRLLSSNRNAAARRRTVLPLVLAVALALTPVLTACGKRGKPEPPPEADGTYPRTYPAPSTYPDYPRTEAPPPPAPGSATP